MEKVSVDFIKNNTEKAKVQTEKAGPAAKSKLMMITSKETALVQWNPDITNPYITKTPVPVDDDFRSVCPNVFQRHHRQSISGLHTHERS